MVPEGRVTGLIGPNGSGKTTLFNSIAGYHPIDTGSIRFLGREISDLNVQRIARLGLVRTFQQTRIYAKMDCVQNMRISIPHRNAAWRDMFAKYSPAVVEKAEHLLEFAMALMNEPKVLLLDEPTAGINPTLINGLIDRLQRANRDFGITLFIIEHNMRVIMNMAGHIYCLALGKLLASGPPENIRNDPRVIDAYLGAH
jgi:ABC-type branched-subunit amino acid transport system ATPase component